MSTLTEVMGGIEAISKSIDDIGKIVEAVQSGKGYLDKRYQETKNDVREILEEMNKTLITTSSATSILTHFSFVDDPNRYATDLREFNNRIVDRKAVIVTLEHNIDDYRGHCSKIKYHADKIKSGSGLDSIFRIFGINTQEENDKLSEKLQDIYNEELSHYLTVYELCNNLNKALNHIHEVLGGPGILKPEKVPEAAALMAEYGKAFMKIESQANYKVLQIRELIRELS